MEDTEFLKRSQTFEYIDSENISEDSSTISNGETTNEFIETNFTHSRSLDILTNKISHTTYGTNAESCGQLAHKKRNKVAKVEVQEEDEKPDTEYILNKLQLFPTFDLHDGNFEQTKNVAALDKFGDIEASEIILPQSSPNVANEDAFQFWKSKRNCVACLKLIFRIFFGNLGLTLLVILYILFGALIFQKFEYQTEIDKYNTYAQLVADNVQESKEEIIGNHSIILSMMEKNIVDGFLSFYSEQVEEDQRVMTKLLRDIADLRVQMINVRQREITKIIDESDHCATNESAKCEFNLDADGHETFSNDSLRDFVYNRTTSLPLKEVIQMGFDLQNWVNVNRTVRLKAVKEFSNRTKLEKEKSFLIMLDKNLEKIIDKVHSATKNGWIHDSLHRNEQKEFGRVLWTPGGSILYCITVITTIGYGHITPSTMAGRLGTIIYACFGIPMMLLCLTNIGALMANMFRLIYRSSCFKATKKYKQRMGNKDTDDAKEPGVDQSDGQQHISITVIERNKSSQNGHLGGIVQLRRILYNIRNPQQILNAANKSKDVEVPASLVLVVFILYNLIGSLFFKFCENWSFLDSFYFSFTTLSTIGFGDLVPRATGGEAEQYKSIMCSFYVLFGLSLCIMSFDLLEKKCTKTVKKTIEKIQMLILKKESKQGKKMIDIA